MLDKPMTLGENIDLLWKIREDMRELKDKIAELQKRYDVVEAELTQQLAADNTLQAAGHKATATIQESVVPKVTDWDEFYRYIHRNHAYHLLARSPLAAPYRELMQQRKGKDIPGVVPYTRRTLHLLTRT